MMRLVAATAPPETAAGFQGAPRRAAPASDISSLLLSSFMLTCCVPQGVAGIGEVPDSSLTRPR
ncbi:hypothetical protein Psi02_54070 [Planotetraspora silvatica]|uniref:Uncharacterized protein n=1 Tax=Planotetraspora silvatica TaxID=234614 RepID=A0A8J3UPJ0_9ACTN|nr:hypothetical protein Psi02_54070 [Planotetraspora silvatica]